MRNLTLDLQEASLPRIYCEPNLEHVAGKALTPARHPLHATPSICLWHNLQEGSGSCAAAIT